MIQGTSLIALRTMEFFTLCSNVNDYLTAEDLPALKLNAVYAETYLPAFNAFDEALQPFRKTGHTQTLLDLDARRDAALVGLARIGRAFIDFPEPAQAEAASLLMRTLEKYGKSPQTLGLTQQTGVMVNLLQDLDTPEAQAAAQAIGATPWITTMRDANTEFMNVFKQRTEQEATIETGRGKATRTDMQAALTQICTLTNALALVNGIEPYQRLIDNINREISRAKQIARQRSSARAAGKENETTEEETDE